MKKYKLREFGYHRIGRWEYSLQADGSVSLHDFHGNRTELHIPDTLAGRPVTTLGRGFSGPDHLSTVIIPDSVHTIGKYAFNTEKCPLDVWIPDTVTRIDETAFADNPRLCIYTPSGSCAQAFALEHDIAYRTDTMPEQDEEDNIQVFQSGDWTCHVLKNKRVQLMEYNGCAARLTVPGEIDGCPVHEVMPSCFYGNDFLEEVILPEGLRCIGHFAFSECPSLRSVHIPQSVTFLGSGVFADCSDLEDVNLPPALNMLHMCLFSNCTSLKRIALPDQLRIICPMAFGSCTSLEEIQLNDKLQTVTKSAFWKCTRLRKPNKIPESLDEEGREAFNALLD